jgi:nitrous oxide reductase accessory protein NosL
MARGIRSVVEESAVGKELFSLREAIPRVRSIAQGLPRAILADDGCLLQGLLLHDHRGPQGHDARH